MNRGHVAVISAAVLFGTTGAAQVIGAHEISPWVTGAFRLIIGGPVLILFTLLFVRRSSDSKTKGPGAALWLIPLSSAGVVLFQFCFFEGVSRTGVATGTIVAIGSSPIIAGLLGFLFFREKLGVKWLAATVLAISGCTVLLTAPGKVSVDPAGVLTALLAGLGYAVYVVTSRAIVRTVIPSRAVAVILCIGACFMVPFLWFADLSQLSDPKVAATLLYLGVFATAGSYLLLAKGLVFIDVASASVLLLVEPVVGSLLGVCLLGERFTLMSAAGILLVLAGLVIVSVQGSFIRAVCSNKPG